MDNKGPSEGGEAESDTTNGIAEVEMLEDILDWGGGTVWRHGDQLVCYESGKNWEAWETQAFSGGVRKEGPIEAKNIKATGSSPLAEIGSQD